MYSKILIRYGELTLKGKNRGTFIDVLARNIKQITGEKPIVEFDRMYLNYNQENLENLKYVFGITSYSPVVVAKNNLEQIKDFALKLVAKNTKTFKIAARRSNKSFEYSSNEINNLVGAYLLKELPQLSVDVHNPDQIINVEVRAKETYIFSEVIQALGGLPVGISGQSLHLMSGGIDSPVAAFELMKRGLKVVFLSFITPPQTDQKTIDKMKELVKILTKYQDKSTFYLANYSKVMNYLSMTSKESYRITLMRRSFYRIAYSIAQKKNIHAISNGENLGQVASQTLESMNTISSAISNILIFRPLLTNDKVETINIAKKINTYDISIGKCKETCELFAPKEPVTKPYVTAAIELEKELHMLKELEEDCINNNIEEFHFESIKK